MAHGLCVDDDGAVYFGEYRNRRADAPVAVWRSGDRGRSWQMRHEFAPGVAGHIHAVRFDADAGAIWVGTGDRDERCYVGFSRDGARTFTWVGHGAQRFRTCSFAFFRGAVVWGMDADFEPNHVIRWDRESGGVGVGTALPDATYYARRIDSARALLAVCQGVAEVWIAGSDGSAVRWLGWTVLRHPPRRGPYPTVRLARGSGGAHVHLNPLRVADFEATIFRLRTPPAAT